jgi:hypothetical protein
MAVTRRKKSIHALRRLRLSLLVFPHVAVETAHRQSPRDAHRFARKQAAVNNCHRPRDSLALLDHSMRERGIALAVRLGRRHLRIVDAHGRTSRTATSRASYARRTQRTPCRSVVISSPTSAPAVLPSRSCAPSNAFAAVATTEIASDNLPMISSISGLIGGTVLARLVGRGCRARRDERVFCCSRLESDRFAEPMAAFLW